MQTEDNAELLERLAALEWALENQTWQVLNTSTDMEFSRQGLRTIVELARVMYLKNPLIKRGVTVQRLYTWGQGFTVRADDPDIDQALADFYADPKNVDELSHLELSEKEVELQVTGNLFWAFFVNKTTGAVRVRSWPVEQIDEVLSDPNDSRARQYYRRIWQESTLDTSTGHVESVQRAAYYPDWRYNPTVKPPVIGELPVIWDTPVFHVKTGGFPSWQFGLSSVYAAIDWARGYKEFLEDWAAIVRAYRKFAFQLTQPGSKSAVTAAKAKLQGADMPPVVGSTFIAGEGASLQPVKTSGATVSADDGRRLLLMVAAAVNLPETFFGDTSVGTLATAQSLDRPTELAMKDRQALWSDMLNRIHDFVLLWQVKAPGGKLRSMGRVEALLDDGNVFERVQWNDGLSSRVAVEFPTLIQADAPAMIGAAISAATLDGKTLAGTIDLPTLSNLLLTHLGVPDADEVVKRLFPDGSEDGAAQTTAAESAMIAALESLRNTLAGGRNAA